LTQEEGEYLVRLARTEIEARLGITREPDTSDAPEATETMCGVFVTLNKLEGTGHRLRGCIGYPYPVKDLLTAVGESALNAAFDDPRFPPVLKNEMDSILVEVSVLTPPEKIKVEHPKDIPVEVVVGRDGLIMSRGYRRGLLLPQVAVEWGWDSEEFLAQCCYKAGLPPDSWLLDDTEVQRFQAIIYSEDSPRGIVSRHELS
jgi:uncharacterized protein (TIGR00296 family)